jgi:hypothetical protein
MSAETDGLLRLLQEIETVLAGVRHEERQLCSASQHATTLHTTEPATRRPVAFLGAARMTLNERPTPASVPNLYWTFIGHGGAKIVRGRAQCRS